MKGSLEAATRKGAGVGVIDGIQSAFEDGRFGSGPEAAENFKHSTHRNLVKGYSLLNPVGTPGAIRQELTDDRVIGKMADFSAETLSRVIKKGVRRPDKVIKSFYGPFGNAIQNLNRFSPSSAALSMAAKNWSKEIGGAIGKSLSLSAPLPSAFAPFDLIPYVRTIYPVYTPLRNKIPRVPGQGTYHRGKIMSSITGSLPSAMGTGSNLQDDSTSEFFGGGGFATYPNPLPNQGAQNAYDLILPFKFFALTESVSWLAQFSGQGFDDLYGLASLILLQEFMLLEEHDMLASSSQAIARPGTQTAAARAAAGGETALSGVTTNVYVEVSAVNFWGETMPSAAVTVAWSAGQVVDVTINPTPGALGYCIYVTTGASPGTYYRWTRNTLNNAGVFGGNKLTLQGAMPVSGPNPLGADSGTGASTRQESLISVLSGQAYNGGSGVYPGGGLVSESGVNPGYLNLAVANTFNIGVLQNALVQMFSGPTGYFANPSEIICSPYDAYQLAASIQAEQVAAYQFRIQQSEMANVTGGIAVGGVVNPVTRSIPEIVPHPYLPQGNALLMSYTLPQTQNNLGNVVENVMVQDYAQIGWPVIDPAFRQSILRYGLFWFAAPQYCAQLSGLQANSATTPYS